MDKIFDAIIFSVVVFGLIIGLSVTLSFREKAERAEREYQEIVKQGEQVK